MFSILTDSINLFFVVVFCFILLLRRIILPSFGIIFCFNEFFLLKTNTQLVSHGTVAAYAILSYVSVPLSLDTIFTEVMKTENGRTMTIDRVKASLVQLGCSQKMLDEYIIGTNISFPLVRLFFCYIKCPPFYCYLCQKNYPISGLWFL